MEKITVYGSDPCRDTQRSLKKLDEMGVEYEYRDVDHEPKMAVKAAMLNGGQLKTPTIVIPDIETPLVEPLDTELENALLHSTRGYLG